PECRPGLSFGPHSVDVTRMRERATTAHVRQDLAAGVVHDEDAPIQDAPLAYGEQVAPQCINGDLLEPCVEGRLYRHRGGGLEQKVCCVWCQHHTGSSSWWGAQRLHRGAFEIVAAAWIVLPRASAKRHGAPNPRRGAGVWRFDEDSEHACFRFGDAVWRLPEQRARRRAHTLQLATKGYEVQVGFKNLPLRPVHFERARPTHLLPLLCRRARSVVPLQLWLQERRELHRNRAGATNGSAAEARPRRRQQRHDIDAAVAVETPILRCHHRGGERA